MKKILLISYYFTPCEAIGTKRWSEFFQLFDNDTDFEITVLTANWAGERLPHKNIIYIGDEIEFSPFQSINREFTFLDIIKHPSTFLRSLDRKIIGDQWYLNAKNWINDNKDLNYEIVIASYTPINAIRLGTYAAEVFDSQYIVDMRDMMSIQGQKIKAPVINYFDNLIDRFWLSKADRILSVGPTICEKASQFYKKEVNLIYNAFLAKDLIEKTANKIEKKVVFSYLGTMGIKRNPRGLLILLNEYAKQNDEIVIEINFASQDNPFEFINDINIDRIKINWLGYLDKKSILALKNKTNSFILLEDMDIKGKENVTGKVFEYMLEQKPILAFCHEDSDIKEILQHSQTGNIVTTYEMLDTFMDILISNRFHMDNNKILEFSRENQYAKLKKLL